jgi:anti-anti-sigma factor
MQRSARDSARPSVDVEHHPASAPEFAAIVHLRGEHDMATASEIAAALNSVVGNIWVDLSDCSFLDSSTLRVLLEDGRLRQRNGHRLALRPPESSSPIFRLLEIMGVNRVVSTHVGDPGPHATRHGTTADAVKEVASTDEQVA